MDLLFPWGNYISEQIPELWWPQPELEDPQESFIPVRQDSVSFEGSDSEIFSYNILPSQKSNQLFSPMYNLQCLAMSSQSFPCG